MGSLLAITWEYVTFRVLGHKIVPYLAAYRSGSCSMFVEMANLATKPSSRDGGLVDRLAISTVVSGVVGPHRVKYMSDLAEVLLDGALPGGVAPDGQKSSVHALSENLEERNGIIDALEVQGYIHPDAEFDPLFLGSGVFFVE